MNPYQVSFQRRVDEPREKTVLKPEDFFREISSSQTDVERALYPFGQNRDPIVRKKGLRIYDEMLQDDQVKAVLDLRKQARLSTPWEILPSREGNRQSEMYADFIKDMLVDMRGTFEDDLYQIYSAIEYGFSISELVFKIIENGDWKGKIGLDSIKTKEPFDYDFKTDEFGNLLGIVYNGALPYFLKNENGELGTGKNPFPVDKFIVYPYNMKFSNWYGTSDLQAAFRSWNAKKIIMRFWNVWLERYASPFIWASVDPNISLKKTAIDELQEFMNNLSARSAFRAPKGVELHPVTFSTAAGDAYEKAIEAHNRFIAHAILVPNLLGYTQQPSVGSFALGKKHFDAFLWILEKMGRDTSETIVGEQIISRLINLNFPNADKNDFPKFKFQGIEEESIEARARIITMLSAAGFVSQDETWVREFLTLPKKKMEAVPENAIPENVMPKIERMPEPLPEKKGESQFQRSDKAKREPNLFEKKIKISKFEKTLDSAQEAMREALAKDLEEIRNEVISFVQKKGIVAVGNSKMVDSVKLNVGDLKETLRRWLSKIFLDSKLKALEELGESGVKVEITKNFQALEAPMEPWEPLSPQEAVDFFNRKVKARIVEKDGKKKLIELASRRELSYYDSKAFAVAGIVRDDILNDVKQALLNGIKRQDESGAIKDLKDVFNKYVESGIEIDEELLEPSRLNSIVRTNMAEAVNEGRRAMYEDPDVEGFVQFWMYSSILDERTTDYCRCMDEKIFREEDLPILNPPAHYNCRAFTVPITQWEIDQMKKDGRGIKISEACPDRAKSFTDIKRDPVEIPPISIPSKDDVMATEKLKQELMQIIVKCPYSYCQSSKISLIGFRMNVGEFLCESCTMPFRVSKKGDVYLYDAGIEKWERVTTGLQPVMFKGK